MRVAELVTRENGYERSLCATLSAFWTEQTGRAVSVVPGQSGRQQWQLQPMLSAYVAAPDRQVRRWIADQFRHTTKRTRRHAQWLLGTGLASRVGLALGARSGLSVSPKVPNASNLVIIPGNRRVRIVDLGAGTTWSIVRDGQPTEMMARELAVRRGAGPWLPIEASEPASDTTWIAEPVFAGLPASRTVDPGRRRRGRAMVLDALTEWSTSHGRRVETATWFEARLAELEALASEDTLRQVERAGHVVPLPGWRDERPGDDRRADPR